MNTVTERKGTKDLIKINIDEVVKGPGLCNNGVFTPWDQLVMENKVIVKGDTLRSCDEFIEGMLILPDFIVEIGDGAFLNCKQLQCIMLPDNIEEIGWGAFNGCNNLKHIFIPENSSVCRAQFKKDPVVNTYAPIFSTERVVSALRERNWHIAAAESCTAGLFSAEIAGISGASDVLEMGFVTYSEGAKEKLVGVDPANIEKYGVVSEAVAIQMAVGAAMQAHAEVGVGITGYAGPGGGTEVAPVGTICVSLYIDGTVYVKTLHLDTTQGRNMVRKEVVDITMEWLSKILN